METVVSYDTYKKFAKRYRIRLTKDVNGRRSKKNIKELSKDIKRYEQSHGVKKGLYV